jgi:prephenate dehydrogenase
LLCGVRITQINRVAVVGLGLIGGSLLLRLPNAVGYDVAPETRTKAAARLGPQAVATDLAAAVDGADLVVLAVPLPAVPAVLKGLGDYAGLLTDVTSVKVPVGELVATYLPSARWVGGHPMAGKEASGFDVAEAGLLDGCAWALCLEPETALDDWLTLAGWVTGLGGRVVPLPAAEHDTAVARISHLPHLVAAAIATGAADGPVGQAALGLGAGSFRDATRVAATRPPLTAAMCGGNAAALRTEVDALIARLTTARTLLSSEDPVVALTDWLTPAYQIRSVWPPVGEPTEVAADRAALLALGQAGGWLTELRPDASFRASRPSQREDPPRL